MASPDLPHLAAVCAIMVSLSVLISARVGIGAASAGATPDHYTSAGARRSLEHYTGAKVQAEKPEALWGLDNIHMVAEPFPQRL